MNRYWAIVESDKDSVKTKIKLAFSKALQKDYYIAPVVGNDYPIATSEFFLVKLRVESDYDMLINYVKRQDCEIVENIDYMPLWYKLKAPVTSNGLSMSNLFYESGYFEEVDPCFMFNFKPNCINEPNYSSQ